MREIISSLVKVAAASAIVLLCFWLFKHRTRATIEVGDKAMDPALFPDGSYSVDARPATLAALKSGDFVAYRNPKDPTNVRIARVVGMAGERVEITKSAVLVNGVPLAKKIDTGTWTIPETKVPRGCAYILSDDPFVATAVDSRLAGPISQACILGTVQPSR